MGGEHSKEPKRDDVTDRLRGRFEQSRRWLERRLRHILGESTSPPCCSVDKVAFVKARLEPGSDERPRTTASTGGPDAGSRTG